MSEQNKLILIDGTQLAYRMYFALIRRPLMNSRGENTSAVFGFTNTVLGLMNKEAPEHIAIIFDAEGPTFRHELYEEYKGTREKMPDDLYAQIPIIKKLAKALGFPVLEQSGVEADDLIGSLASQLASPDVQVQIMSSDKDFAQLVNDNVVLRDPGRKSKGTTILGKDQVVEKFGVRPDQIIDYLALVGDTSDNVPGVPKIGPKTAVKLLTAHDSLDGLYEHLDELSPSHKKNLEANQDSALLSKTLVTIRTDLALGYQLEDLRQQDKDMEVLEELLKDLEFHKLLQQLTSGATGIKDVDTNYTVVKDEDTLFQLRDAIQQADVTTIASLTHYEERIQTCLGIGFCVSPNQAWYVPLTEHAPLPPSISFATLAPLLTDPQHIFQGHDVKETWIAMKLRGYELTGLSFDSMIASYLLNATLPKHDIDVLATQFLNRQKLQEKDFLGSGRNKKAWEDLFIEEHCQFVCEEVDLAHQLCLQLQPMLEEAGLSKLMAELEMPLLPVLGRMELNGIALNISLLDDMATKLNQEVEDTLETIKEWTGGEELNVNSSKQVAALLFDKMKLHEQLKVKLRKNRKSGSYSTDSDTLAALSEHDLPRLILEVRGKQKLLSTYIEAFPKLSVTNERGEPRIHTRFRQTGTVTGRLSSFSPNLQNIPVRTEQGRAIRTAFVPKPDGWTLLSADYSQIELRILAHVSGDKELQYAFQEGIDIHTRTASLIFNIFPEFVTPEQRSAAKATNFGLIYGIGPNRLAKQIDVSVDEAESFMKAYFQSYPQVQDYLNNTLKQAKQNKYVETLLGRIRRLHDSLDSEDSRARSHAENIAVNTPIQGTAADLIKKAMIQIDKRLKEESFQARMLLQVHDELVFEAPEDEVERLTDMIEKEMSQAIALDVPLVVEIGKGNNWSEAH
jgi:DNA polymerase-1